MGMREQAIAAWEHTGLRTDQPGFHIFIDGYREGFEAGSKHFLERACRSQEEAREVVEDLNREIRRPWRESRFYLAVVEVATNGALQEPADEAQLGWVHGNGDEVYRVRAGAVEYLASKIGDEEHWRPAFSHLDAGALLTVEHMIKEIDRLTKAYARLQDCAVDVLESHVAGLDPSRHIRVLGRLVLGGRKKPEAAPSSDRPPISEHHDD